MESVSRHGCDDLRMGCRNILAPFRYASPVWFSFTVDREEIRLDSYSRMYI